MKKHKYPAIPLLSEYWKPPADVAVGREAGKPVACLATTFEFDAGFFEEELLPRFLGLRFDHVENERTFIIEREEALAMARVGVLVEASKFDPRQTTLQWDQIPIHVPGGVQHAKVTLLVWENVARLIVGSANLTRQGYRINRELFAALDFFDHSDSVPLELLYDVLEFLETLCVWARSLPAASERVRQTLEDIRARTEQWSNAPREFAPRKLPRAAFVGGHPAPPDGVSRSVIDQLFELWHTRRVYWLTILTPQVGQIKDGQDALVSRLAELSLSREASCYLVVPERPMPEGANRRIAALPKDFAQCWTNRFRRKNKVLLVPPYIEGVDKKPRPLHMKAILIEGDSHDLLMIGSSNFTPHGMGVGAFNCEANLVFLDSADEKRDGQSFWERLGIPVRWDDALDIEEVDWEATDRNSEDPPSYPYLPWFFAWASYSQKTGELRVALDRAHKEPINWRIWLFGPAVHENTLLFSRTTTPSDQTELCLVLDAKARQVHITALKVEWQDENLVNYEAYLTVSVEDQENDLLPPEEFRSLTLDAILDCLLSGREPAEWIQRREADRSRSPGTDVAIESLRAVDTSNYLLYRARRFGSALTRMACRILDTPRNRDAIRYRLLRDPLGPVHLAETLCGRWTEDGVIGSDSNGNPRKGNSPDPSLDGFRLYCLAEIILLLGHVGAEIRERSCSEWPRIKPLFGQARERIVALATELCRESQGLDQGLVQYWQAAFAKNGRLLKLTKGE